jgi:hypothetical protein
VNPLEQLFRLEVEYHQKLRVWGMDAAQASATHMSFALQSGYEQLIRECGHVTAAEVMKLTNRMVSEDARDVLAARDSVLRLLGIHQFGGSS